MGIFGKLLLNIAFLFHPKNELHVWLTQPAPEFNAAKLRRLLK